ncbi:BTAD domain-containing putative transcriptional regulator [Umezawaea endophytica]|uniref:Tetratricopeptide repeat protein n=1 Tax=Umezawaea endophytica TaxID=1654476 RepID=A0A9X2VL83_9PSEU|nr:BTAD domain-containing putative transcriptional regulator [Umezawaea endophytica]MCS7478701.1 tetratricopeptide repeat protein [Umezawaea endophytica]
MASELRVLGPVELQVDGRLVEVGHARQRCVLAVLLVEANRVVTMEQLLDRVWADRLPHKARPVASNYVSRLRRVLTPADDVAVVRRGGGYVLEVDPEAVDLHRFRRLVEQARGSEDPQALALLEEAVGLWRGEPFAGLETPWLAAVRTNLERERVAARLDRVDVALRCGRHTEVLPELFALADQDDLDERVAAQFMLALHNAGRTADALVHYRRLRARLIEQLGTEPGTALQDLHQRILDTDPALTPPTSGTAAKPQDPVPQQLPAPPRWFTGRGTELARLDQALATQPGQDPPSSDTGSEAQAAATVVISAIGGAGGIGKTWLALTWSHRHLDRFPDGQLFVDLRGFSPDSEPMPPTTAVRGFLHALGADPGRIPVDPQAQAALYRSLVTHKRMLIVLDNAADAAQAAPLLPGGDSCTVLVTSRKTLTGLITRHGAHHLTLDTLGDDAARALLTRRLGAARVAAEPDAVAELVGLCGGFPLALGIIAGRAYAHPDVPLAEFAADLRGLGVDALEDDDPATSLPTVLSWSFRALTTQQQIAFGLLGMVPGPDVSLPAAASLTGLSLPRTTRVLRDLQEASLLNRDTHGRYSMHDLIRHYATDTAHRLPQDVRESALRRAVDFYLHTAHTGDHLLDPRRHPLSLDSPALGSHPRPLPDPSAALAWFDTEHPCLLAAQHTATTHRWHQAVWQLAWTLNTFHTRQGHCHDHLTVWKAAQAAADHLPDPAARAMAHRLLGDAYAFLGQHDEAIEHLHQSLALAEQHHDHTNQALAHRTLARAWERQGDDRRALEHATHALDISRTLDDPVSEARMLNNVGWFTARLGDSDQARDHCRAALALFHRHDDPIGEAAAYDSLGYIEHHAGHHEQAIPHYQHALTLYRDHNDTFEVANSLDGLGHPHAALGQHDQARAMWREALELYRDQGRTDDAARIQRQLDALATHPQSLPTSGVDR